MSHIVASKGYTPKVPEFFSICIRLSAKVNQRHLFVQIKLNTPTSEKKTHFFPIPESCYIACLTLLFNLRFLRATGKCDGQGTLRAGGRYYRNVLQCNLWRFIIWLVLVADIYDWLMVRHYSPIMLTGRLRACKNKAKRRIIYKQLINFERSVFTGKSLGQYGKVSV